MGDAALKLPKPLHEIAHSRAPGTPNRGWQSWIMTGTFGRTPYEGILRCGKHCRAGGL